MVTETSRAATSGSWYSPYDGATWTAASDVDIDHLVPLAEAWDSGADSWTTSRRQAFANDLTRPQLLAVTDHVNQAKGDQDPATWMPSRTTYRCTYVRAWVQVKYYYGLSVDSAEKSALQSHLAACSILSARSAASLVGNPPAALRRSVPYGATEEDFP
ncbi:hypothetical protein SGLAM104S_10110 [Streptomyces glaucescens]